jgi:3-phytase
MRNILTAFISTSLALVLGGCGSGKPLTVRFATFYASLNRDRAGQLVQDLSTGNDPQIKNVAEVIQRVRPDVLLINEFDHDPDNSSAPALFQKNYLSVSQNGAAPIEYPFRVFLPVNTGVPSGFDLDNDGQIVAQRGTRGYGNDCFGFGQFPGQYGMLLLSKYPFHSAQFVWTFQKMLWKDMPGAMLPTKPDGSPWYDDAELAVLRLSSKSHWDVALQINRRWVHVLASHPTPPAFDGPEDRNGKRNHDEIALWKMYLDEATLPEMSNITRLKDDDGRLRGIEWGAPFVILGDMNADPNDGASVPGAIQQLLDHPRVNSSFVPGSEGALEAARTQGGKNTTHKTPPQYDTADFSDGENGAGNLRCDYVLPSKDVIVKSGGVFWPPTSDTLSRLVQVQPTVATSDHRLVWLDVSIPPRLSITGFQPVPDYARVGNP